VGKKDKGEDGDKQGAGGGGWCERRAGEESEKEGDGKGESGKEELSI